MAYYVKGFSPDGIINHENYQVQKDYDLVEFDDIAKLSVKLNSSESYCLDCKQLTMGLRLTEDVETGALLYDCGSKFMNRKEMLATKRRILNVNPNATVSFPKFVLGTGGHDENYFNMQLSPMNMIRHSCFPSCGLRVFMRDGKYVLGVFSVQNLKKGVQLTIDYGKAAFPNHYCSCPKCTRTVSANTNTLDMGFGPYYFWEKSFIPDMSECYGKKLEKRPYSQAFLHNQQSLVGNIEYEPKRKCSKGLC